MLSWARWLPVCGCRQVLSQLSWLKFIARSSRRLLPRRLAKRLSGRLVDGSNRKDHSLSKRGPRKCQFSFPSSFSRFLASSHDETVACPVSSLCFRSASSSPKTLGDNHGCPQLCCRGDFNGPVELGCLGTNAKSEQQISRFQ